MITHHNHWLLSHSAVRTASRKIVGRGTVANAGLVLKASLSCLVPCLLIFGLTILLAAGSAGAQPENDAPLDGGGVPGEPGDPPPGDPPPGEPSDVVLGLIGGGPLTVHPVNPRYFADGSGNVVYLTGSHTWSNLQENWSPFYPVTFDFPGYLDFLESYDHNFIRLWRQEMPAYQYPGDAGMVFSYPHPWKRTGPGNAGDGDPKFNLTQFDPQYFNRLRDRCIAAGDRGMYVSIMLFEGHAVQYAQQGWFSHPFKGSNNINGINADTNGDGQGHEIHLLGNNALLNIQKDYIKKVIDTVNDLDNVMYEICNEATWNSAAWQEHMIDYINSYQASKPQQHPILYSTTIGGNNSALWASDAEAVAPWGGGYGYDNNPPAGTGAKVVMADSDHIFGCGGNEDWVWKSFTRGLNPIYMDSYYDDTPYCPGPNEFMRTSMGYARNLTQQTDMAQMKPHNGHASSGYCLADLGEDYIVFVPGGGTVNVNLADVPANVTVEWLNIYSGQISNVGIENGGGWRSFSAPSGGSAVLHLSATSGGGGGGGGGGGDGDDGGFSQPTTGDQYGRVVANAGDLNADGYDDLVVGAPYTDANGHEDSGKVYAYTFDPVINDWELRFTFQGQNAEDRLGWSVAPAGDVNGDGYDDIIVGVPYNDDNGSNAGKAYVHSGYNGSIIKILKGQNAGDRFGYAVSAAGDVNGGPDDFLVGAPYNDHSGADAGKVYVYNGGDYQLLKTLKGQNPGDLFGRALAGVGRTNSDSFDDFAVGAPYNDHNGSNAGKVYVYSGQSFSLRYTRKGMREGDKFGWSIAAVSDTDGDDRDDFAVGSPYYDAATGDNAGRIDLVSAKFGGIHWTRVGQGASDLFGYAVAGAGDVNASGSGDVVVGAPQNDAGGSNAGRAYVLGGGDGSTLDHFSGQNVGDRFGWSVTAVGDVDGDSLVEVTIGASQSNTNGINSGQIYTLSTPQ